ncbi:MAG: hypothetical protein K6E40_09765, partial [Desulfovibrio sp.]|nr:hypothetical protein [Desulfovibrio sp.]
GADAQTTAFTDTWHWGDQAEAEYTALLQNPNAGVLGESLLPALRSFLGTNSMMTYLVIMSARLAEIRRLLKETGSLYLHCDPTASHYVKLLLDGLYGARNYRNEIVWKRSGPKSNCSVSFPAAHDVIFRYSKSGKFTFNRLFTDKDMTKAENQNVLEDPDGRQYVLGDLASPNKNRPNLTYEFLGVTRVWRWTKERMQAALDAGRIVQNKPGESVPRYKRYLDESLGVPVTDVWTDIAPLQGKRQKECMGYPTQKPLALLERIIEASSNPGDLVLDPFCGCGTAVHAAQKLGRRWIGIDITHLAVSLISQRMQAAFPDCRFRIEGTPKDVESARFLAEKGSNGRYDFQFWALGAVGALPSNGGKKGADGGSDGYVWAYDSPKAKKPFKINFSVKSGKIPANHIRELRGMLDTGGIRICVLLTLESPSKKMEADALAAGWYEYPYGGKRFRRIQILTVQDILDGRRPEYFDYGEGAAMASKPAEEKRPSKYRLGSLLEEQKAVDGKRRRAVPGSLLGLGDAGAEHSLCSGCAS